MLLLDEPAAGMNPQETAELTAFIRKIRDDFNLTVLMIEHHMDLVMDISDRVYVLNFGALIAEGTPELYEHEAMAWIAPAEIPQYDFCPADTAILDRIKEVFG